MYLSVTYNFTNATLFSTYTHDMQHQRNQAEQAFFFWMLFSDTSFQQLETKQFSPFNILFLQIKMYHNINSIYTPNNKTWRKIILGQIVAEK